MPQTPTFGLRYPDSNGHTRTWEYWQQLAEDAEKSMLRPVAWAQPVAASPAGGFTGWALELPDNDSSGVFTFVSTGFRCARAGLIMAQFWFGSSGSGQVSAQIRVNDTFVIGAQPAPTGNNQSTVSALAVVSANDKIAPWLFFSAGGGGNAGGSPYRFVVTYLGPRATA